MGFRTQEVKLWTAKVEYEAPAVELWTAEEGFWAQEVRNPKLAEERVRNPKLTGEESRVDPRLTEEQSARNPKLQWADEQGGVGW